MITIYLKRGEIKKAVKLIPVLENILEKYRNKILIDIELSIMFTIVKCYIADSSYQKALISANRLMHHPLLDKREDLESYLKIVYLIIHFELKNYELLKHLIISTYRYLYKRKKLFKAEMLVLDFIRKLPKVESDDDLKFLFVKFRKGLLAVKKDKYEKNAFEYFDLLEWANSKISIKD